MKWETSFTDEGYVILRLTDGKGFMMSYAVSIDQARQIGKEIIKTAERADRLFSYMSYMKEKDDKEESEDADP